MRSTRILFIVGLACLLATSLPAAEIPFTLGFYAGEQSLMGGDIFSFKSDLTYGATAGLRLGAGWEFGLDASFLELQNDEDLDSTAALGSLRSNIPLTFSAGRFGGYLEKWIWNTENRFNIALGIGGGILAWKMKDPSADSTYQTVNKDDRPVPLKASELILSPQVRVSWRMVRRVSLTGLMRADYLTGGGVNFAEQTNAVRDRWLSTASLGLTLHLGSRGDEGAWQARREQATRSARPAPLASRLSKDRDSDGDGIFDDKDKCPATRRGASVDRSGCPVDSDGDSVFDGLDDCPESPREAAGLVDINGCPVDSDFDGIPDYLDACPSNAVGALVDARGCPTDSDNDGVADGLDDCPATMTGAQVDRYGCLDLAVFNQPMVLYIDYSPGSFEVDPRNQDRLRRLASLLQVVPDITLEVQAYSDDIGTEAANRKLSEKRANRVRDYLVAYGVATARMRPVGMGEANPVASNQTAEGRSRNRRIEIIFHK